MKYIYYWHFANRWYMDISDNPDHWQPISMNEENFSWSSHYDNYLIENSVGLTHRQIKERLMEQYPDHVLVKKIAYHEGSRWHGNKVGSRERNPYKKFYNRAKYREKDPIKQINA